MPRVVLTGATGFLGSRVLAALGQHDVLCLSRDPNHVRSSERVRAVRADLGADGDWIEEVGRFKPEWCMHLAWAGLPDYSLRRCRENLDASLRLTQAMATSGVRRMIVAGSCWEYGGGASGAVREDDPVQMPGVFAATKRALMTILETVARESRFEYRWARIFFVYGPGQRPQSLLPQVRAAYRAGKAPDLREPSTLQDFVHVDDVAEGLVTLASAEGPSGVFNIGSGQPAAVGEVANLAAEYYGKPHPCETAIPGVPGRGFWADTTRMHALTGWRAGIRLQDGIKKTLAELDHVA